MRHRPCHVGMQGGLLWCYQREVWASLDNIFSKSLTFAFLLLSCNNSKPSAACSEMTTSLLVKLLIKLSFFVLFQFGLCVFWVSHLEWDGSQGIMAPVDTCNVDKVFWRFKRSNCSDRLEHLDHRFTVCETNGWRSHSPAPKVEFQCRYEEFLS